MTKKQLNCKEEIMTVLETYKKMYAITCAALSDGIDLLNEGKLEELKKLMETALDDAEYLYYGTFEDD